MEKGETPHETAIRETKEETGISDIKFIDGFEEEIAVRPLLIYSLRVDFGEI